MKIMNQSAETSPSHENLPLIAANLGITGIIIIIVYWLCYTKPHLYVLLITMEDGWGEFTTAVALGTAAIIFMSLAFNPGPRIHRILFFSIGFVCIFGSIRISQRI